jgi:hypothetical protein
MLCCCVFSRTLASACKSACERSSEGEIEHQRSHGGSASGTEAHKTMRRRSGGRGGKHKHKQKVRRPPSKRVADSRPRGLFLFSPHTRRRQCMKTPMRLPERRGGESIAVRLPYRSRTQVAKNAKAPRQKRPYFQRERKTKRSPGVAPLRELQPQGRPQLLVEHFPLHTFRGCTPL